MVTSAPVSSARAVMRSRKSGSNQSSESRKMRYRPEERSMPRFRAAPGPALACRITWKRGSFCAYSSKMAGDVSVEPSSTQTTSRSERVCPATLSRHCRRWASML